MNPALNGTNNGNNGNLPLAEMSYVVCHTDLLTARQQYQDGTRFHPDPALKLSAKRYDIYHCCVYSEKLLMMDKGTVRNMKSTVSKINLKN